MNDYHSLDELSYKPRWLASSLRGAIRHHPVIILTGARQVGKSTLLRNERPFSQWHYVNLDDYDILAQAQSHPESLWSSATHIIIDEIQRSPNLLNAVKFEVDRNPKIRFVLSGSSNILLMKQVSESLAGRAVYFKLNPLCIGEILKNSPSTILEKILKGKFYGKDETVFSSPAESERYLWKGFMPALLRFTSDTPILKWWEGYVTTYLERDLRQISQIDSLPDYRRLMTTLALHCGQILNQTAVSREIGITQPTTHRYINLLETTYLLERIPAFTVNRKKRLVKSPKILWMDPGLVSYLCGYHHPELLSVDAKVGGIFEAMVYLHLDTRINLITPKPRIYYWRTVTGKEIDFVIEWGKTLISVEAKMSQNVHYSDIENLRLFMEEYPETKFALLIYTGNKVKIMDKKILAIPWYLL